MAKEKAATEPFPLKKEDVDALHNVPAVIPQDKEISDLPRLTRGGDSKPDIVVIPQIRDIVLKKALLNAMSGEARYLKDSINHEIDPVCIAVSKSHKAVGDGGEIIESDRLFLLCYSGVVYQTSSEYAIDSMRRILRVLGPPGKGIYKVKVAKVPGGNAIVLLVV